MDWIGLDWIGLDWIGLDWRRDEQSIIMNEISRGTDIKIASSLQARSSVSIWLKLAINVA